VWGVEWVVTSISSCIPSPAILSPPSTAPVRSLGYMRVMFAVEGIDTLAQLSKLGATVVDEVLNDEDIYR
jgi:hypothetical protein